MKRILVVTDIFPFPPVTGGMLRDANIIEQLSKHYDIDLISYNDTEINDKQKLEAMKYCCNVQCYYGKGKKYIKRIINIFSIKCDSETRIFNALMAQAIIDCTNKMRYEFIWCERLYTFQYVRQLTRTTRVIVDMHDVEREAICFFKLIETSLLKKIRFYIEEYKVKHLEKEVLANSTIVSFVSERDRNEYSNISGNAKLIVVNNGIDIKNTCKVLNIKREKNIVLFVGSLKHPPNLHGLKWFVKNVWPNIVKIKSEVVFNIVGSGDIDDNCKRLFEDTKGVNYIGFVDEVYKYMKEATCMVVPLFSGSGTRLKILEAFSFKLPVISTDIGAEGLDCKNGESIIIANDIHSMGQAVIEVLNNNTLAEELSNQAYNIVDENYNWEIIGEKLACNLKCLIN